MKASKRTPKSVEKACFQIRVLQALQGTVFNLTQMIFAPVVGTLSDRIGRKRILILVALGSACVNLFQAKAKDLTQILVVRALGGIVSSGGPVYTAYLMEETSSEEELREVLVLQRLVVTIGAILGPLIAKAKNWRAMGRCSIKYNIYYYINMNRRMSFDDLWWVLCLILSDIKGLKGS